MEVDHACTRWHKFSQQDYFKEIVPFKKIVFEHFNPHFLTTVLFDPKAGETAITWTMQFDTAEMRDIVIKAHNADEGLKQNMEKLGHYIDLQKA